MKKNEKLENEVSQLCGQNDSPHDGRFEAEC